jgi:hypothetical protein
MGLVLEYFRKTGQSVDMATESARLPRPDDDKCCTQRRTADPVFAAFGKRRCRTGAATLAAVIT